MQRFAGAVGQSATTRSKSAASPPRSTSPTCAHLRASGLRRADCEPGHPARTEAAEATLRAPLCFGELPHPRTTLSVPRTVVAQLVHAMAPARATYVLVQFAVSKPLQSSPSRKLRFRAGNGAVAQMAPAPSTRGQAVCSPSECQHLFALGYADVEAISFSVRWLYTAEVSPPKTGGKHQQRSPRQAWTAPRRRAEVRLAFQVCGYVRTPSIPPWSTLNGPVDPRTPAAVRRPPVSTNPPFVHVDTSCIRHLGVTPSQRAS